MQLSVAARARTTPSYISDVSMSILHVPVTETMRFDPQAKAVQLMLQNATMRCYEMLLLCGGRCLR